MTSLGVDRRLIYPVQVVIFPVTLGVITHAFVHDHNVAYF